jgi:hypothetical protein
MALPSKRSPAREATRNRAGNFKRPAYNSITGRELEGLAHRLNSMGPRVIYEMLRDMLSGRDPAAIVADFARLDPATFAALAALVIDGRRV